MLIKAEVKVKMFTDYKTKLKDIARHYIRLRVIVTMSQAKHYYHAVQTYHTNSSLYGYNRYLSFSKRMKIASDDKCGSVIATDSSDRSSVCQALCMDLMTRMHLPPTSSY
jgi:hypothetical protein